MKKKEYNNRILLVNQKIGYLFRDIIIDASFFSRVDVFCGSIDKELPKEIKVIKSFKYNNDSIFSRFITWILFTLHFGIFLFKNKSKYKNILIVTNPPFTSIITSFLTKNFSVLIYDLYPDIIENFYKKYTGNFFLKNIIKSWKKLTKRTFLKAKNIFTLSEEMSELVKNYLYMCKNDSENKLTNKISIIPPWNCSIKIDEETEIKFREKYRDPERILISYSGNIGITHPLEELVESVPRIKKYAKLLIIGSGAKLKNLKNLSKKLKISSNDLNFIDYLSDKEYQASLSEIDLSIVALDLVAYKASLPSKVFNSLAFGKPIAAITNKDSSLEKIVNKYDCGFVIAPNKDFKSKFFNHIKIIFEDKNVIEKYSQNSFLASKDFDIKNAKQLVNLWLD